MHKAGELGERPDIYEAARKVAERLGKPVAASVVAEAFERNGLPFTGREKLLEELAKMIFGNPK